MLGVVYFAHIANFEILRLRQFENKSKNEFKCRNKLLAFWNLQHELSPIAFWDYVISFKMLMNWIGYESIELSEWSMV